MLWAASATTVAALQPAPVADVLAKAAAYLADYEKTFSVVVSEEHYAQSFSQRLVQPTRYVTTLPVVTRRRATRAEVIMMNVGENAWVAFRDVFEQDGKPVRDRDERLQRLFLQPSGQAPVDAMAQAKRIVDESARYNLGSLQRNINVPTMALTYLHRGNQTRSTFTWEGRDDVNGAQAAVLAFAERGLPTVIQSDKGDLPATGRFWIDPASGRVLKSEIVVQGTASKTEITVTYGPAPRLSVWVPVSMKEHYALKAGGEISAEAKYSNFRQYAVIVESRVYSPELLQAIARLRIWW
jgi:hypothetical protein